tara:strand:- start:41 stop:478 length:438 start_codon:yes stop_codon:yes gene_type:complete
MKKLIPLIFVALLGAAALAANTTNEAVFAVAPQTVACTDSGAVAFNPDPDDVRWDIWNTDTDDDICIAFCGTDCTAQAANRASLTTCSFVLGPYSTSGGTPDVWTVSSGLKGSRAPAATGAFECDCAATTDATCSLVVTAWREQK